MKTRLKLSPRSAPKCSSMSNGSLSHVFYLHTRRPTSIDVACPKCAGMACAKKTSEMESGPLSYDLSGAWHLSDWKVICKCCTFRQGGIAYASLPKVFWESDGLWAWNEDHLNFLEKRLSGEDTSDSPYDTYSVYIEKEWLLKKTKFLKVIQKLKTQAKRTYDRK